MFHTGRRTNSRHAAAPDMPAAEIDRRSCWILAQSHARYDRLTGHPPHPAAVLDEAEEERPDQGPQKFKGVEGGLDKRVR